MPHTVYGMFTVMAKYPSKLASLKKLAFKKLLSMQHLNLFLQCELREIRVCVCVWMGEVRMTSECLPWWGFNCLKAHKP